jgi:hypothetical protein
MDSGLALRSDPARQAEEAVSQWMSGGSKTPTPRGGRWGPSGATAQKIRERIRPICP